MGAEAVKKIVPESVDVACHNGPDSSTLSGPSEDMQAFVTELQEKGIFARLVNVSNIAYHSRYIKPAAPLLLKYLKGVSIIYGHFFIKRNVSLNQRLFLKTFLFWELRRNEKLLNQNTRVLK